MCTHVTRLMSWSVWLRYRSKKIASSWVIMRQLKQFEHHLIFAQWFVFLNIKHHKSFDFDFQTTLTSLYLGKSIFIKHVTHGVSFKMYLQKANYSCFVFVFILRTCVSQLSFWDENRNNYRLLILLSCWFHRLFFSQQLLSSHEHAKRN